MGTRGLWGFIIGGEQKLTYNHFDSYPQGLGADLLRWVKERDRDTMLDDVLALELVEEGDKPTTEQIEKLRKYHDPAVSTGSVDEWYSLLRDCQGDPEKTLESGFMIDSREFAYDSLFCEYGYVIDLDQGKFEVYEGFVKEPHLLGRFAERGIDPAETHDYPPRYDGDDRDENICIRCSGEKGTPSSQQVCSRKDYPYPIKLIATFDLDDLPDTPEFVERAVQAGS